MDSKTRKMEDTLITVGNGVILFAVWSLVRFIINNVLFGADIDETLPEESKITYIIILWVVTLLDAGIRLYIGFAARSEGLRRKKLPYLVFTCFVLVLYILALAAELFLLFTLTSEILYAVITLMIDITFIVFLLQLLINTVGIRKRRKQYADNGGQNER